MSLKKKDKSIAAKYENQVSIVHVKKYKKLNFSRKGNILKTPKIHRLTFRIIQNFQMKWIKDNFVTSEQYYIENNVLFNCYESTWKGKGETANSMVFARLLATVFPNLRKISVKKELFVQFFIKLLITNIY